MGKTIDRISNARSTADTPRHVVTLAEYDAGKQELERRAANGEQIVVRDETAGVEVIIGAKRRSAQEQAHSKRMQAKVDAAILAGARKKQRRKIDPIFKD